MSDFIYDDVEINVQVSEPVHNYQDKEVYLEDENGLTVYADQGYDALFSVEINPVLQSRVLNVSTNGVYGLIPDEGYCGIDGVTVNVNIPESVSPTYRKVVSFSCDLTSPYVFTQSSLTFSALGSSYNTDHYFVQQDAMIQVCIYLQCEPGYSDLSHIMRIGYIIGRNSGAGTSVPYMTLIGFKPDFGCSVNVWPQNYYSGMSAYAACNKFLSTTFNFQTLLSSDNSVLFSNPVTVTRTCNFANSLAYNSGELTFFKQIKQ